MALTLEQERTATELMARVRSLLERAIAKARPVETAKDWLGWVPDIPIPGLGLLDAVRDAMGNETQAQIAGAIRQVEDLVPRWTGAKYHWLQRGTRDDGTPYAPQLWVDEGNAIASTLATALQEMHAAATWTVYRETAEATEEQLAAAGRAVVDGVAAVPDAVLGPWSWQTKLVLVGVGVVALVGAAGAASLLWQANKATPLGLAMRGAGLALRTGARPLNDAAGRLGRRLADQVKQAEANERTKAKGKKT
ncbi:hypothetical protein OWM54_41875 [Myxococcus sp. MISCRS1]|uniref:hypothetical protein n=1 Tax=Myxococcus sp. MISCRS1 TaxID=2996786 RepID=UPI00226FE71D|nr:hypothetical protein [Myxococcus sp. MISCRS1]MCY1003713.1 hypothetical protein [Myxococcus sp. MISCRS1]